MEAGDNLTADQCAIINLELATITPADIPPDQVENVRDYLNKQFLNHTVEPSISAKLEILDSQLEALD
jgi:hypothetical protein